MTAIVAPKTVSLSAPIVISVALHIGAAALLLLARHPASAPVAPTYRVNLIAAPPGPRSIGVVKPPDASATTTPRTTAEAPAPSAPVAPIVPSRMAPAPSAAKVPPKVAPKQATPGTARGGAPAKSTTAPAPVAGGGPTGGRGADVANVNIEGIEFPFPGYLQNVVRQIALRFSPGNPGTLRAEVAFLIRRDGSIAGLRLQSRSGVYAFDTEAMGAVDAAAQARAFGPLPQGFTDDVLPVIFSFDPRLIR